MSQFTTLEFVARLEEAGYEAKPYSGRGMHTKQCVSVRWAGTISRFLSDVFDLCETAGQCASIVRGMRMDSMGLQEVYYWPSMVWEAT